MGRFHLRGALRERRIRPLDKPDSPVLRGHLCVYGTLTTRRSSVDHGSFNVRMHDLHHAHASVAPRRRSGP